MGGAIWSRDASPEQIAADAEWRLSNERRIEACVDAGMPVPPHYWDAEGARLAHKQMILMHLTPKETPRPAENARAYNNAVLTAFDTIGADSRKDFREHKAAVEYAGRKRL